MAVGDGKALKWLERQFIHFILVDGKGAAQPLCEGSERRALSGGGEVTRPPVLHTVPVIPSSVASRRAVGRKPIPCTMPLKIYSFVIIRVWYRFPYRQRRRPGQRTGRET